MNVYAIKNCNNCIYTKCVGKVDYNFDLCPVERKKQEIIKRESLIKNYLNMKNNS